MDILHVQRRIDRAALARFMRFGWIPGSDSIFQGIHRLEPVHYLVIQGARIRKQGYWAPDLTPLRANRAELCEMLDAELDCTIANKLIADVPLERFSPAASTRARSLQRPARHSSSRRRRFRLASVRRSTSCHLVRQVVSAIINNTGADRRREHCGDAREGC